MSIRDFCQLSLLCAVSLLIRIKYAGIYAESWDAVDFALGLVQYDIFQMQPHFPGYPLYILVGHLFSAATSDPIRMLTLLSAVAGSLSLFPFFIIAKRFTHDHTGAWAASFLFALSPLLALTHVTPMSEALGLLFVLLLVACLSRLSETENTASRLLATACLSAVLYAALLGIRTSFFPLGFLLFYPLYLIYRERKNMGSFLFQSFCVSLVFLCSLLSWLLPTAATEGGLLPFLELGKAFTVGHFTEWGGTSLSTDAGWFSRLHTWVYDRLFLNGLLGTSDWMSASPLPLWIVAAESIVMMFLLLVGISAFSAPQRRSVRWLFLLAAIPYTSWVFFGQNSEKARHVLPLLPWLYLFIGYGWSYCWKKVQSKHSACLYILCSLLVLGSLSLRQMQVLSDHLAEPPAKQLVSFVTDRYRAEQTLVYTWEEQRLFDYYAPDYKTERVRSFPYFAQSLLLAADTRSHFLVTNAVLDGFGANHPLQQQVKEVARFTADPFLYPTYHTVILYEVPATVVAKVREGRY